MERTLPVKVFVSLFLFCFAAFSLAAQTAPGQVKQVNFRYSQNPKTKPKAENAPNKAAAENANVIAGSDTKTEAKNREPVSIAKKTLEIAKRNAVGVLPTEIYKVGVGDVLFINLQNAAKDSTYYTVLSDGTIDYPLAGEMVTIAELTTDEIAELLRGKIKLYENPQISVGVREFASHKITVLGLVEKAGEKRIQREAVPLYVVRAEAVVQAKATQAVLRRADGASETIQLKEAKSDDVLIFPGDIVEFGFSETSSEAKGTQFYYIGGEVVSGGQKDFHPGLTLTQAIIASGGLRKPLVKRVVVRRKNFQGLLEAVEYNLKLIKEGKQVDPQLHSGDTIEIGL
jgi:protein involved in polysaccharide export with SLBB domain